MSEACQAGIQALGLELFSTRPAEGLTAFRVPTGLKDTAISKQLADRFGITTVGGQDKLKGQIVRVGHMGYMDELDVIGGLAALEMVLSDLGFEVEPGCAVTAAQQVFWDDRSSAASNSGSAGKNTIRAAFDVDADSRGAFTCLIACW